MNLLLTPQLYGGLLMVALGIGLGVFLTRKFGLGWRLWWIGAAGFVLSQVGHIPFNALLDVLFRRGIFPAPGASPLFYALVLGFSAGIWEEFTRAAVYRWWADDARSWRKGVLLGAGHGGIEAIIFGLVVLGTFVYMASIRGMDLSRIAPPEQLDLARQQVEAYWSAGWTLVMLGPLERVLTIPCHIAFSVLVLQAFLRKQSFWVGLAVLWHAALDATLVYLSLVWPDAPWRPFAIEGVIAIYTAISLLLIFRLRRPEPVIQEPALEPLAPVQGIQPEDIKLEVTEEDLDRSRYR